MNSCLDFRRRLLAEPHARLPELQRHQQECQVCAEFAARLRADEALIADAVRLQVPEGLAERVMLRQALDATRRQRSRRFRFLAAAASVVLALTAALVVGLLGRPVTTEQLVMQHIRNELDHLAERRALQLTQVNAVLRPFDTEAGSSLGTVHYAGACTIRREAGAHLVIEGQRGPVTILLMPEEGVEGRFRIQDRRFSGVVIPAGDGSIAIVGEDGEPLDAVESRVERGLRIHS